VRLYATLRRYYPEAGADGAAVLEMAEGATLTDLLPRFGVPREEAKIFFVNNRQQGDDYLLRDGDRVAIFPLVAGG